MANNAYQALTAGMTRSQLTAALITRGVYVLGAAEDSQTIDLETSLMVAKDQDFFYYDSTDTTTAHDGTSVLVDINGRRYKIVSEINFPSSVLDRIATPPGSPTVGDTYLITAGGSGAWSGKDDDVTIYTAQGWKFILPRTGFPLYVEDETAFYHYSAGGVWTSGLGSLSITASAITPVESNHWGLVSVEDVLNTPPASPTDGLMWLVGTSPTGVFVGSNDKIALRRSSAWEYIAPYEGARIWDKDQNQYLTYTTSWTADAATSAEEYIATYDFGVSGSADPVDFTGLAAFLTLYLEFQGISSGASKNANILTSTDDGSTFQNGASDYKYGTGSPIVVTSLTHIILWAATTDAQFLSVRISGFNSVSRKTSVMSGSTILGYRDNDEINNAIRIDFAGAGAFTSGRIVLYGVRG